MPRIAIQSNKLTRKHKREISSLHAIRFVLIAITRYLSKQQKTIPNRGGRLFFPTLSFASPCHVLLLVIPLIYHLMHAKFIAWKWWFDHHRKSHFGVSEFYSWAAVPSTCWICTTSFYRCIFSLVSLLCSFFLLVLGHSVTKRKRMNFNLDVSKHASDNVETLSYALPSFFLHMRFLLLFYCMMFLIRSDVNPWHCWNVYVFARTSSHFHKILFGWITYPNLPI